MSKITLEQAQEAAALKKDELRTAKAELKTFRKENKLKPDETPGEEKVAKKMAKLMSNVEKAEKALEEANAMVKELKPAKSRVSSYDYPEGMTAAEKKKYRAKMRREKKSAEKAAAKAEAGEAPEPEAKPKKRKDKAPANEDED